MYETEVVDQEAKIVKLKAEGQDEHVIKKQVSLREQVAISMHLKEGLDNQSPDNGNVMQMKNTMFNTDSRIKITTQ